MALGPLGEEVPVRVLDLSVANDNERPDPEHGACEYPKELRNEVGNCDVIRGGSNHGNHAHEDEAHPEQQHLGKRNVRAPDIPKARARERAKEEFQEERLDHGGATIVARLARVRVGTDASARRVVDFQCGTCAVAGARGILRLDAEGAEKHGCIYHRRKMKL